MVLDLIQMKPARCTQILSTFISTSLRASDNYVPIIRRSYCIDTVSSPDDGHIVARGT